MRLQLGLFDGICGGGLNLAVHVVRALIPSAVSGQLIAESPGSGSVTLTSTSGTFPVFRMAKLQPIVEPRTTGLGAPRSFSKSIEDYESFYKLSKNTLALAAKTKHLSKNEGTGNGKQPVEQPSVRDVRYRTSCVLRWPGSHSRAVARTPRGRPRVLEGGSRTCTGRPPSHHGLRYR